MDDDALGSGVGGEAGAILLDHLFATYPLRKIYVEIPEFTVASVEPRMRGLFTREGVLRKHFLADGVYWDQHIFATYRAQWLDTLPGVLAERSLKIELNAPIVEP
jgi:RimJ/RimL family protein N-acetyltransferase